MKPIICAILLIALFLLIPQDAAATGRIDDYKFLSKALNREMTCRVYLPGEYDPFNPDKRFPVVYFLHGASLGYDSYDALFVILEQLIAVKLIQPLIMVLPDGLAPPYNGSFYTNSVLYGNFEDYIAHDLVSFVDSAFYTKNDRNKRAIMGASMGGYGALKIAFKHQEQYIAVSGHSGPVNINMLDIFIPDLIREDGGTTPFHWSPGPGKSLTNLTFSMAGAFSPNLSNIYQVDFPLDSLARPIPEVMERWKTENVCELARTYHPGPRLGIIFDCGNADDYYLYYQNRSLNDTLTKYGIPHKYEEYLGTHTSGLPVRVSLALIYFDNIFKADYSGVPGVEAGQDWKVFLNPSSGNLTVLNNDTPGSQPAGFIRILDGLGRSVAEQVLTNRFNTVNLSGLPEGLYFYRIHCGTHIQAGKIIISDQ
jgi:enterochelin esterase-like enzyme